MDTANLKNLNDLPAKNGIKIPLNPDDLLIKITDDIKEPIPLFAINFLILASHGNLLVIKAKQKAGKTFLICILSAAYHKGQYLSIKATRTSGKCFLWVDSEQSKSQVFLVLKRNHRMSGLVPFTDNSEDVGIYYLSELTIEERWEMIELLAARKDCEVLAIDVITDFVNDPNDLRETKAVADKLQAIAKKNNIVIVCTIHENKDNSHATGHLGSALMKKAETVLSLEKNNGVFTVKSPYARHGEVDEFSFNIDEHGLPCEADTPIIMTRSEKLNIEIAQRFKKILTLKRLSHKDLTEAYELHTGLSKRAAKEHITRGLDRNILDVQDKLYSLKTNESDSE